MSDAPARARRGDAGASERESNQADLDLLLRYIKDARGFDFGGYKRTTLTRRIRKRMNDVRVADYLDYRDLLESDGDEFGGLFNTVLINVTGFFRDPEAWDYLQHEVVRAMLAARQPGAELRIWSAGCSSGEEAYSLAMVFAEVLGLAECLARVKIYGTDIDDEALRQARAGVYSAKALESVPDELRDRYFGQSAGGFSFHSELHRRVIFGRHDISRDAPISRLDLLVCRNTLMYFNVEAQAHIVDRFHFGLRDRGFLFLGKAETLLSDVERFEVVNMRQRIFRRRAVVAEGRPLQPAPIAPALQPAGREIARKRQLSDLLVETMPNAAVAVGVDGKVAFINAQARAEFGLSPHDVGRYFRDLELSYRPAELRSPIEQAYAERRTVRIAGVERRAASDEVTYFDVAVVPLHNGENALTGVALHFVDVTVQTRLRQEVKQTREDLETAYEELQSTSEELETTNEELQSSIEELETTNEELQSTNEELETTNQELHAGNQQLEAMNEEVRRRSAELDEARSYLEGVLSSVAVGVVVLDAQLRVRSWNQGAENLWGLRATEVGDEPFFELDFGLPTQTLHGIVTECLATGRPTGPVEVEAVSRIGRTITCSVACSALSLNERGVVILMDEAPVTQ